MKRFENNYEIKDKQFCDDYMDTYVNGYTAFTNSATTGILAILQSLNLSKTDEIILQEYGHPASDNVCNILGLKKVYSKNKGLLMDVDDAISKITPDTKVMIYSETNGFVSEDIFKLKKVCEERGIFLLEDSAASFKQKINNVKCGTIGHASVYSFSSSKLCYLGGGGCVISNNKNIINKINEFKHITNYKKYNPKCLTTYLPEALYPILKNELLLSDERVQKRLKVVSWYKKYMNIYSPGDYENYNAISLLSNTPKLEKTLKLFKIDYRSLVYPEFGNDKIRDKHIDIPYHINMSEKDVKLICNIINKV